MRRISKLDGMRERAVLSLLVASLSWLALGCPILSLKDRLAYKRRISVAGTAEERGSRLPVVS
jgi:hypothetical protein